MKKTFFILLSFFLTSPLYAKSIENPLKGNLDPNIVVGKVIDSVLGVIGTIALLIFIYGGFEILMSLGESSKIKNGRNIMIWAAIGLIIIFGSFALSKFALNVATFQ